MFADLVGSITTLVLWVQPGTADSTTSRLPWPTSQRPNTSFGLLGFEETKATVVSGEEMSSYMGFPDWVADRVTFELTGARTHQEVQILRFHHPKLSDNPTESHLDRLGFNHVCFAVDDLDATLC